MKEFGKYGIITPEYSSEGLDILIVLGKNLGVGVTGETIRKDNFHLSTDSRINAIAAGMLWRPGITLLFSTGETTKGIQSESGAMIDYMFRKFPHINAGEVISEWRSIDTAGNAEEVAKMLPTISSPGDKTGLLTTGYHLDNAATLFRRYGVKIDRTIASENVVKYRSLHHDHYLEEWSLSERVGKEKRKELVRKILLATIDPKGKVLRMVTSRTRG